MEVNINDILYAVITVVLPLALSVLWQFVQAKVGDSKYAAVLSDIYSAVEYVNQTFVDALKEKGCFDEEAKAYALSMAKDAALNIMSAGTRKWLEKYVADIDEWLTVQIEAAIKDAAKNKGVA